MHVDPTPQDAPRPDVDAPTLHAAYAPPLDAIADVYGEARALVERERRIGNLWPASERLPYCNPEDIA